jgi:hypothetical protein
MSTRCLLPFAALLSLTACSYDFERSSEVRDRRILAIQVEPPELAGGTVPPAVVHARVLVVDPQEPQAVVPVSWWFCMFPARAEIAGWYDGESRCPDNEELTQLYSSGQAPLSAVALSVPVPEQVAGAVAAGLDEDAPQLQVQVHIGSEAGDLVGIKVVTVTAKLPEGQEPNRNPVLQGLTLDGVDWPADTPATLRYGECPDERRTEVEGQVEGARVSVCEHEIEPIFDEAAAQFFQGRGISGELETQRERLRFGWFSDGGSFRNNQTRQKDPRDPVPDPVGPTGVWREPPTKPEQATTLWVVVRDGRGGTHWERREIRFE